MRAPRLAAVIAICLAVAPAAWAASKAPAKPVRGAQYEGKTAREGTATVTGGKRVREKATVLLKVAKNGRTVKVALALLPSSCTETGQGAIPKTSPARISSRGAFSGTISYQELFAPGVDAIAHFSGHFNGRRASGTIRSQFLKIPSCNSSTSFSA
ncbi:MAG TPA: hypothetical protein VF927_05205, partial [Solirubrobacteraceae bacterium]